MNRASFFKRAATIALVASVPKAVQDAFAAIPASAPSELPASTLYATPVSGTSTITIRNTGMGSYFQLGDIVRKSDTGEILRIVSLGHDGHHWEVKRYGQ